MALPTEYDTENESIARRQKYAEMLRQQSLDPLQTNQMAGGYVVPVNPLQGMAKLLQAYQGKKGIEQAETQRKDLAQRRVQALQDYGQSFPTQQAIPAGTGATGGLDSEDSPYVMQGGVKKPTPQDYAQFLAKGAAIGPEAVNFGSTLVSLQNKNDELADNRAFRDQQAKQQAQARLDQIEAQAREGRITREEADKRSRADREYLLRVAASLKPAPQPQAPVAIVGPDGNPVLVAPKDAVGKRPFNSKEATAKLPTSALKMQQEELDTIGTASAINADLGAIAGQMATGGLDLGPIKNLASQAQNKLGLSDEKSRNFATLNSTLEKLRNDTLRLNKGVQTEGDAQRAWNELISNINDKDVVKQRIEEIQAINKRAADLRKMNVDVIRNNFGVPALDTSGYEKQPAAVGKGQAKWEVVR